MEGFERRYHAVLAKIQSLQFELGQLSRRRKIKKRPAGIATAQDKFEHLGLADSKVLQRLMDENHILRNKLQKQQHKLLLLTATPHDKITSVNAQEEAVGQTAWVQGTRIGSGKNICSIRPRFGTRFLNEADNILAHNAWDNVKATPKQISEAMAAVEQQQQFPAPADVALDVRENAAKYWNVFYNEHKNKFYKDRHWLLTEFPELLGTTGGLQNDSATVDCNHGRQHDRQPKSRDPDPVIINYANHPANLDTGARWGVSAHASRRILELGCGAGNTVFPLLVANKDPGFFIYACDFAPSAVDIVRSSPEYDDHRCHAFVCDIAKDETGLPHESLDIIIGIFVLSALHPSTLAGAVAKLAQCLKPGGVFLMRDYGRHDMAQLRMKKHRLIEDNFYVRGEGTQVHFFSQEVIRKHMKDVGLDEEQNIFDRRLIVNRKTEQQMQRVWIQCKYRKPYC